MDRSDSPLRRSCISASCIESPKIAANLTIKVALGELNKQAGRNIAYRVAHLKRRSSGSPSFLTQYELKLEHCPNILNSRSLPHVPGKHPILPSFTGTSRNRGNTDREFCQRTQEWRETLSPRSETLGICDLISLSAKRATLADNQPTL